jgi:hypothetical protein
VNEGQSPASFPNTISTNAVPRPNTIATYQMHLPLVRKADPPEAGRATLDRPDDVTGYQVHLMYVLPNNGIDRRLDISGTLATSVLSFQNWLAAQTGGTRLRLDTYQGVPDVTFHRLARPDATLATYGAFVRDAVETAINAVGFNQPNKLYAVYYDGTSTEACGGAAWPPALVGNAAMLYLQGLPNGPVPCNSNAFAASPDAPPGYLEFAMLHEIFHTLGAASNCAPHQALQGHVSDSNVDLMYSGSQPWQPALLDVGHDDYWGHGNANCLDLSKSAFMDPLPANPSPPPGWPHP